MKSDGYIHKEGLVYKNQFHVIFCPKYRRKVLVDGIDERLKAILPEEAAKLQAEILSLEVMPDHVHLFLTCDPRLLLHRIVKQLKGASARRLRMEFPELKSRLPCLWTRSYFCCTVGHISETTIRRYIEMQKDK